MLRETLPSFLKERVRHWIVGKTLVNFHAKISHSLLGMILTVQIWFWNLKLKWMASGDLISNAILSTLLIPKQIGTAPMVIPSLLSQLISQNSVKPIVLLATLASVIKANQFKFLTIKL
jgi:hypothetical protein